MVTEGRGSRLPPYQRLADGLVLPAALGGQAALDFCNTCAGRGGSAPREYLASYEHLAVFAREAGLVGGAACAGVVARARARPEEAAAVLSAATGFREALARVCLASERPGDRSLVAARIEEAARTAVFELAGPGGGTAPAASWWLPERLDLPLLAVARSAADLLTSEGVAPIRSCPGRDCGWLFLDRTGRRRWCSMTSCGNREKARRHAARARSAPR